MSSFPLMFNAIEEENANIISLKIEKCKYVKSSITILGTTEVEVDPNLH